MDAMMRNESGDGY